MKKIILFILTFLLVSNLHAKTNLLKKTFCNKKSNLIHKNIKLKKKNIEKKEKSFKQFYIGNKTGLSRFSNLMFIDQEFKIDTGIINPNTITNGILAGYRFNKIFNVEIGYDWFDKSVLTGKFISGTLESKALGLLAKIDLPLFHNFKIYTRIGGIYSTVLFKKENKINKVFDDIYNKKFSPTLSLGTEYDVNDNLTFRLDYQWFYKIGSARVLEQIPNNKSLSFYLIYRIPRKENKISNVTKIEYPKNNIRNFIDTNTTKISKIKNKLHNGYKIIKTRTIEVN